MSKLIKMSFGAFPIFQVFINLVSKKRLVVEQKWSKCGSRLYLLHIYGMILTVRCLRSVWSHSVHFRFCYFRQPCILKTDGRRNGHKFGPRGYIFGGNGLLLTLKCARVQVLNKVTRYISDISDFHQPCFSKKAGQRGKRTHIWASVVLT